MVLTRGRTARSAAAAVLAATALALSGCGGDDSFELQDWHAPGQNASVGDVLIRYAHVAEPKGEPWQPGDDVPAYVWLMNQGDKTDRLVSASSPNAESVNIVNADGKPLPNGVELPPNKLQQLEPTNHHLLLRDVREVVRGGDFMKITLNFEKAGSVTFNIQSQIPVYDSSPSPSE
ncbi:copper chaperone PCu(A)C [Streptomyces sp. NPDC056405]|uniref:copper chaperone PCu(A)C n=1 Tax=Streptomyces sp. NPDC056405 TaxID=3345811 RepID=UPI0035DDAACA